MNPVLKILLWIIAVPFAILVYLGGFILATIVMIITAGSEGNIIKEWHIGLYKAIFNKP